MTTVALILGSLVLLMGVGLALCAGWTILVDFKPEYFRPTQGLIVLSHVKERSHSEHLSGSEYAAEVVYQYTVAGRDFRGSRLKLLSDEPTWVDDRRSKEVIVESYPLGMRVTVYYDSRKPQSSTLSPGSGERFG